MRRHEKHACGGVVDVTLLPFLFFSRTTTTKKLNRRRLSIHPYYTPRIVMYIPPTSPFVLKENTLRFCVIACFFFLFLFFVFVFRNRRQRKRKKKKKKKLVTLYYTFAKNARTHVRTRERTHHSPNAHKNVVESTGGDIQRFFVAQRR